MKAAQAIALLEAMAVNPHMFKEAASTEAKSQSSEQAAARLLAAEAKRARRDAKRAKK